MKHLIFFILGCFSVFYFSCSSPLTEIYDVRSAVLYDFQKAQNKYILHLAVYARLNQGADTDGVLLIKSPGSDYTWTIESPLLVLDTESGYTWIGRSDILPPPQGFFPAGRYSFIYTDAGGKKTETFFDIAEQQPFNDLDLSRYREKRLGIFDETGLLLGYRSNKTDMSIEETAEKYPGTSFTRILLLSDDGSSVVLNEPVFVSDNPNPTPEGGVR